METSKGVAKDEATNKGLVERFFDFLAQFKNAVHVNVNSTHDINNAPKSS